MRKPNYDEAVKIVDKVYNTTDFTKEQLQPLNEYLDYVLGLEAQHEVLIKYVARYFELKQGIPPLEDEMNYPFTQKYRLEDESKDDCYYRIGCEYMKLEDKLSKAGKEE